jgi:aryl-alcohol dehydrogenase-like predicted oxidoreductase
MDHIRLGGTGLDVSRVCMGTWQLGGGWGPDDPEENRATIRLARELGIDFFDTARAYGWGASERTLAEALGDELVQHRERIVIATKGGLRMAGDALVRDSSPAALREDLEASLRALGVDHVDLFLVHWPDPTRPAAETAEVLDGFVRAGLARAVGISNADAGLVADLRAHGALACVQPPYSLLRRGIQRELLPWCAANDVGVMVYGPLLHGLLAGRRSVIASATADDWRSQSHVFRGEDYERAVAASEALRGVADGAGLTLAQLAVGWVLADPAVHAAIVGARRREHLRAICAAPLGGLPADVRAAVEAIIRDAPDLDVASPEHL